MNNPDLAARVATQTSVSSSGADATGNAAFSAIAGALSGGETVAIAGFGTISTNSYLARKGRNSRTGETIAIVASTAPSFKACKSLLGAVNGPTLPQFTRMPADFVARPMPSTQHNGK